MPRPATVVTMRAFFLSHGSSGDHGPSKTMMIRPPRNRSPSTMILIRLKFLSATVRCFLLVVKKIFRSQNAPENISDDRAQDGANTEKHAGEEAQHAHGHRPGADGPAAQLPEGLRARCRKIPSVRQELVAAVRLGGLHWRW